MEIKDLIKSDRNLAEVSNKDLYHLCQEYGRGIKTLRRIFSILLVEVFRRRLHRKYGFESIHEFAAKVGGMNKELVSQVLSLAEKLKDKPLLWKMFRTEGWSKLRVVAGIATVETDAFWAVKVEFLTKPALETCVRAWREAGASSQSELSCEAPNDGTIKLTDSQCYALDVFPKNSVKNGDIALLKPKSPLVQNLGEKITDYGVIGVMEENLRNVPGETEEVMTADIWKTKLVKIRFNISPEDEFKFRLFKQNLSKKRKLAVTSGEAFGELLRAAEWKRGMDLFKMVEPARSP